MQILLLNIGGYLNFALMGISVGWIKNNGSSSWLFYSKGQSSKSNQFRDIWNAP